MQKTLTAVVLFVVALTAITGTAWASFHLEHVGNSRPANGIHIEGLLTAPRQSLGGSLASILPQSRVRARSAAVAAPRVSGSGVWDAIASCESGGNWGLEDGSPFSGGLQFMPSTWRAAGGTKYAARPSGASREQQIAIAQSWLEKTSWSQWPACSRQLGLR